MSLDRRRVNQYLRLLVREMRIKGWTFQFDPRPTEPSDDDGEIDAHTIFDDERRVATVRVCSSFASYSPHAQRRILVHEVAHTLVRPYDEAGVAARKAVDESAEKMADNLFEVACEKVVWAITYAIEHRIQLPRIKP